MKLFHRGFEILFKSAMSGYEGACYSPKYCVLSISQAYISYNHILRKDGVWLHMRHFPLKPANDLEVSKYKM